MPSTSRRPSTWPMPHSARGGLTLGGGRRRHMDAAGLLRDPHGSIFRPLPPAQDSNSKHTALSF